MFTDFDRNNTTTNAEYNTEDLDLTEEASGVKGIREGKGKSVESFGETRAEKMEGKKVKYRLGK